MNEYEMIQKILETSLQRIEWMINEIKNLIMYRDHNAKDLPRINQQIAKKKKQISDAFKARYYTHDIICGGNGLIWVTEENGNIKDQDWLVSSSIPDMAKKQLKQK